MNVSEASDITAQVRSDRCYGISVAFRCLSDPTKRSAGLEVARAEARIIFYYGTCSVGPSWALTREDLDDHFGAPVTESIEEVNRYFRSKLNDLLASAERPEVTIKDIEDLVSEDG